MRCIRGSEGNADTQGVSRTRQVFLACILFMIQRHVIFPRTNNTAAKS